MSSQTIGRILFADNHGDFLDTRAEFLENAGYQVLKAYTLENARRMMRDHWVHLAILDIRMMNDEDNKDTSGLTLAKEAELRPLPKIILTDYPDYEKVREALGAALDGLPPAVDFLAKKEGPEAMIQAVEAVFKRHVRINGELEIRWCEPFSFPHLFNLIDPQADNTFWPERSAELEGLFRKLCYESVQITLGRVFLQRIGKVFLEMYTYNAAGTENQYIIVCGRRQAIIAESERCVTAGNQGAGPTNTIQIAIAETIHFAVTVFQLVSGDLDEITSFGTFYMRHPVEDLLVGLEHLFTVTLAPWHAKGRTYAEDKRVDKFYRGWFGLSKKAETLPEMERRVIALCKALLTAGLPRLDYTPHQLLFHLSDGSLLFYPNPVTYLEQRQIAVGSPILCGVAHGSIDAGSVLVDHSGRTWLVDFANVDQGPLLRDFVALEMTVKLDLLDAIDLQARYAFEKQLLTAVDLKAAIAGDGLPAAFDKALGTVERIRHLAATLVGPNREPYLAGLFFSALARVTAFDPNVWYTKRELIPFAHSLLLAALLCEQITGTTQSASQLPEQARRRFWIDETNKEAWVEGKRVELTPQDFDLLLYLYQHAGQLCSRQAIVRTAFGVDYEEDEEIIERSRLNSAVSRLRQKLEPDPENPRYLTTVRGQGYKLLL